MKYVERLRSGKNHHQSGKNPFLCLIQSRKKNIEVVVSFEKGETGNKFYLFVHNWPMFLLCRKWSWHALFIVFNLKDFACNLLRSCICCKFFNFGRMVRKFFNPIQKKYDYCAQNYMKNAAVYLVVLPKSDHNKFNVMSLLSMSMHNFGYGEVSNRMHFGIPGESSLVNYSFWLNHVIVVC